MNSRFFLRMALLVVFRAGPAFSLNPSCLTVDPACWRNRLDSRKAATSYATQAERLQALFPEALAKVASSGCRDVDVRSLNDIRSTREIVVVPADRLSIRCVWVHAEHDPYKFTYGSKWEIDVPLSRLREQGFEIVEYEVEDFGKHILIDRVAYDRLPMDMPSLEAFKAIYVDQDAVKSALPRAIEQLREEERKRRAEELRRAIEEDFRRIKDQLDRDQGSAGDKRP